jgi:sphinganine-1-phosphate aldolase
VRDPLARLRELQAGDLPLDGGRTLAYVYASGLPDVDRVGREAVASHAGSNGLDPTAFPSLLAMENDLVGFACDLLDAPPDAVGTVTSGGTESVLLAVQAARDGRPEVSRPRMVLPVTAHAAFHKAASYFGVEPVFVPVDAEFRADAAATEAAIAADPDRTVLVVTSAPSYAHGVVDPVAEIAALAAARGIRCHVDACIGGWLLPYAARLGRRVRPWTFAVEGVTSISVDLHKYAYAPKGTSLLLHRSPALRRAQFFAAAGWPGYTMLNSTMQSTKSGGPLAGAWAVVESIGDEGYLALTRDVLEAVDRIVAGVASLPGLRVVVPPDSSLVTLATDGSCDAFTVCDEMAARGWYVQPQMSYAGHPPTVHLSVSAATLAVVDELLVALGESVAAAVAAGPVPVDAEVASYLATLDPAALSDEDFDGLLAASGLVGADAAGALVLPARMAPVNAMLDVASPALREAVLVAFLDRLSRPSRAERTGRGTGPGSEAGSGAGSGTGSGAGSGAAADSGDPT